MRKLTREQVLGARARAQGLAGPGSIDGVVALGVRDTPYGSAREALATRLGKPASMKDIELVWSWRGAPHLHRPGDLRSLASALWPVDAADATDRMGLQIENGAKRGLAAFTAVAEAFASVVTTRLPKGEVSTRVTKAIPDDLSYECRSCAATHISGGIFQLAGLAGGVRVVSEGRKTFLEPLPAAVRPKHPIKHKGTEQWLGRFLDVLGPATPTMLAGHLSAKTAVARQLLSDEWIEVEAPGGTAWATESFLAKASRKTPAVSEKVHLLPPGDPWLQARDRSLVVPERARQKAIWKPLASPGVILDGIEIIGTWRAKAARGDSLSVTVELFEKTGKPAVKDFVDRLQPAAETIASLRGLSEATIG